MTNDGAKRLTMWSTFTPEARRAVLAAQIEAEREGRAVRRQEMVYSF